MITSKIPFEKIEPLVFLFFRTVILKVKNRIRVLTMLTLLRLLLIKTIISQWLPGGFIDRWYSSHDCPSEWHILLGHLYDRKLKTVWKLSGNVKTWLCSKRCVTMTGPTTSPSFSFIYIKQQLRQCPLGMSSGSHRRDHYLH